MLPLNYEEEIIVKTLSNFCPKLKETCRKQKVDILEFVILAVNEKIKENNSPKQNNQQKDN